MKEQKLKHCSRLADLVSHGLIDDKQLEALTEKSARESIFLEDLLMEYGIPKHKILICLSRYYTLPFIEYNERLLANDERVQEMDLERLKKELFFPLSIRGDVATVICYDPTNPNIAKILKEQLGINRLKKIIALPSDVVRIIENNQDVNPNFPPSAARTLLSITRNYLAKQRSIISRTRTSLAEGRTGLAFIRTGFACVAISLLAVRIFGITNYFVVPEVLLILVGIVFMLDGLRWYIPARKACKNLPTYNFTEPCSEGITFLALDKNGFKRIGPIKGAEEMKFRWNRLSPVMRRRFLSIDRTDLSEERLKLAFVRTVLAASRTGMAFARTGITCIGLGVGLFRHFHLGNWTIFDVSLICLGTLMSIEGFLWHMPGVKACKDCMKSVYKPKVGLWDFLMFLPSYKALLPEDISPRFSINSRSSSGIWGTTGLSRDNTLNAEDRNLKSKLRTVMAVSRTGMVFIRTGVKIFFVGLGLLVYFGLKNKLWSIFDVILIVIGLIFIADGFSWHLSAEKIKNRFPYCSSDIEISFPDYGKPTSTWRKVIFSHEKL